MTSIAAMGNTLLDRFPQLSTTETITLVIATVAVLTFVLTFIVKPLLKRKGLKVTIGLSHVMEEIVPLGIRQFRSPVITCKVVNKSEHAVYIQQPLLKTTGYIKDKNFFVAPTRQTFPLRLEYGATCTLECPVELIEKEILIFKSPTDRIKFLVSTSTGNAYYSNSISVQDLQYALKQARKNN